MAMINISNAAYNEFRELLTANDINDTNVRIALAGFGCSGPRFGLMVDDPTENDVTEMVKLGSDAERQVRSMLLSRYACYLIVQSADPRKEVVAMGHSYFALQTRRQEIEDDRRIELREEIKKQLQR